MSFYLHLSCFFIFHSQWLQLFPTQFFSFKTKQNTLQIDKWIQLKCRILKIFLHKNISLKTNSPNCLFQKWFLWNNWYRQIYFVTRKNNSKKTLLFTYPSCEFKVLPSRKWYTFSFACTSCSTLPFIRLRYYCASFYVRMQNMELINVSHFSIELGGLEIL